MHAGAYQLGYMTKDAADNDSSGIGRWIGINALQGAALRDKPKPTYGVAGSQLGLTQLAKTVDPTFGLATNIATGVAMNPIQNVLAIPKGKEGEEYLQSQVDASDAREGKFGQSFKKGFNKAKHISVMAALVGAGIGGYYGHRYAKKHGKTPGEKAGLTAAGAGLGAATSVIGTTLMGGTAQAFNEALLNKLSPETKRRSVKHLAHNRVLAGMPGGSMYGAYLTRDSAEN